MKRSLSISVITILLFIILYSLSHFYLKGVVILDTKGRGRIGNQLFQYAASYALAKETNSKLYILVEDEKVKHGYAKPNNGAYALEEVNIPKINIIYKTRYNKIFFSLLRKKNFFIKTEYVNEGNFFRIITKTKNNKTLIMDDWFESPIFFEKYKSDILNQFQFTKIDTKRFEPLVRELSKKESVCIHIRRGDTHVSNRVVPISFQKEAMNLSRKLIDAPEFFIFSDEISKVKEELQDFSNLHFIEGNDPIEDLYLLSNCGNNIITNSSFSWWAAYLNKNNGFVVAPFRAYNERHFTSLNDIKLGYVRRSVAAITYPKNWILLENDSSDIYTGNRRQLELCNDTGDFRSRLCALESNKPTVITAYYGNPLDHLKYLEWAQYFFSIPFNLVIFTDKENSSWIKKLRSSLPIRVIEGNTQEINVSKLVNEAIRLNPYNSKFFAWCDIGAFKDKYIISNNFLDDEFMLEDKITVFMIKDFKDQKEKTSPIKAGGIKAWQHETLDVLNPIYQDPRYEGDPYYYPLFYFSDKNFSR
ncbi:MAG: alpha-1,2-fucosyltransferase [Pseudomonadota bacterium]